jgi:hypothetical protein
MVRAFLSLFLTFTIFLEQLLKMLRKVATHSSNYKKRDLYDLLDQSEECKHGNNPLKCKDCGK